MCVDEEEVRGLVNAFREDVKAFVLEYIKGWYDLVSVMFDNMEWEDVWVGLLYDWEELLMSKVWVKEMLYLVMRSSSFRVICIGDVAYLMLLFKG